MSTGPRPPDGALALALAALALQACPRQPPPSQPPPAPRANADGGAQPAPDPRNPRTRCPWVWPAPSSLSIAAEPARFELTATCLDGALAAVWRAGGVVSVATRALSREAAWQRFGGAIPVTTDASNLTEPVPSESPGGGLWVGWQTTAGFLRVARVTAEGVQAGAPVTRAQTRLTDPHVLHASGERALLAATARGAGGEGAPRVLLFQVGLSGEVPRGAYVLGAGVLAATTVGAHPRVALMAQQSGEAWTLTSLQLDPERALSLDAPRGEEPLPSAVTTRSASLELGLGGFEFVPEGAPLSGAFLFETVVGAQRGSVRVARFPREGGASLSVLPVVATALGDVVDAERGVMVTWWDERHVLRAATLDQGAPRAVALPVPDEDLEAHGTRVVTCGGARWVLFALRASGVLRLHAAREGCVLREAEGGGDAGAGG